MPQFKVTGPNGRLVTIDGPTMPTEQELDEIFSAAPPPVESAPPQDDYGILGRGLDVVQRIGQTLGRGGSAIAATAKEGIEGYQQGQSPMDLLGDVGTAVKDTFTPTGIGTWKRNTDFDEVLGQAGMEEGWTRAGLGLVGDVVIDPLNIAGVSKLLGKGIGGVAKGVGKVADMTPGVSAVKSAVTNTFSEPKFAEFINTVPGSATEGLAYGDMRRLAASQNRSVNEHAEAFAEEFFKDFKGTKNQAARESLAKAIDTGTTTGDAKLDALIPKWKSKMDELWQTQVDLGIVDPARKRDNYIQYLTKSGRKMDAVVGSNINAVPSSSKTREVFKTLDEAADVGGATKDAGEILPRSIAQVERAKRTDQFLTDVKTAFGSDHALPGMRKLKTEHLSVGRDLKDVLSNTYVPEKIADDLERATLLWEEPNELDGLYKTGVKIWKSMATSINPAHHFTNLMGNMQNMYVGGMSMGEVGKGYVEAGIIADRIGKQGAKAFPKIGKYAPDDLFKWANEYEIVGSAGQMGDLASKSTRDMIANNPAFKGGRRFSTTRVEEPARLAFWLNEVKKGKTPAEAAIRTKDVLFDYAELTKAEKSIRDSGIVPFYTWMRKNVPLQLRTLAEDPGKFEKLTNVANVPWNANESQVNSSIIPRDAQKSGYVPGPMTGPNGEMVMNRVGLPVNDLNKLMSMSTIGDSLGPLPKLVIEGAMNQKFFGGPVQTSNGLTAPAPAAAMLQMVGANALLPKSMEGYVTPTNDVTGRPRQDDVMAWLMGTLLPTGTWGSTAKVAMGEDPNRPNLGLGREMLARTLGLTPDILSGEDQKYELMARKAEIKRKAARKALLEP